MNSVGKTKNEPYEDILTPDGVARYLKIGRTRAFALLSSGEISSFQIGRSRRVKLQDVQLYVERLATGAKR